MSEEETDWGGGVRAEVGRGLEGGGWPGSGVGVGGGKQLGAGGEGEQTRGGGDGRGRKERPNLKPTWSVGDALGKIQSGFFRESEGTGTNDTAKSST